MANKKRTVVQIELHQQTLIRRNRRGAIRWCERCRAEVPMITPEEAAALARTSVRAIFRRIEAGEIHFSELGGALLVEAPPADD